MSPGGPNHLARSPWALSLLAATAPLVAVADEDFHHPPRLEISGGDREDRAYARAAFGELPREEEALRRALERGLEAVRLTDRFRRAEGRLQAGGILLELESWPEVEGWSVHGLPQGWKIERLLPDLRNGRRTGDLQLERWRQEGEARLREAGYPEARVKLQREGACLAIKVEAGASALVRVLQVEGRLGSYEKARLESLVKVKPGRTIWCGEVRKEAMERLRRCFLADKRYFWTAELVFESGTLHVRVEPGPVVRLAKEGRHGGRTVPLSVLRWTRMASLSPLARADRFTEDLVDEGCRRIVRTLRNKGYLEAQCTCRREILRSGPEGPEEVRLVYEVDPGPRLELGKIRFERHRELDAAELLEAADPPSPFLGLGRPWLTPELLSLLQDRVRGLCLERGFPESTVRRTALERKGSKADLVLAVKEGPRRSLSHLELLLPPGEDWPGSDLAQALAALISERPWLESVEGGRLWRYLSSRPGQEDLVATLSGPQEGARVSQTFRLELNRPVPLVMADLVRVQAELQNRLALLGIQRPQVHFTPVEGGMRIEVAEQPRVKIGRLVVQGARGVRASALLLEAQLEPGKPLHGEALARAQNQVGNLGAFERLDLSTLREAEGPASRFEDGDLLLRLKERSPWVFTHAFGYDKGQGYHLGLGAQRLNVGGMGRALDLGLRAGHTTLQNEALRKAFPTTEDYPRSMDSYSVGYRDPRFSQGWLEDLLGQRIQFHLEAAYLAELRSYFLLRRRRMETGLTWRVGTDTLFQVGYRFERSETRSAPGTDIKEEELLLVTGFPGRSVVSAPYAQWIRDRRDNPLDPTQGDYGQIKVEAAAQFFGSSPNTSFVKADLRQQWNWALGRSAAHGVISAAFRVGAAWPTQGTDPSQTGRGPGEGLPTPERFFAGGPGSHRGIEPDFLGRRVAVPAYGAPLVNGAVPLRHIPLGGQGLALVSLEYRFPSPWYSFLWGEVFADSGQVYERLRDRERRAGAPSLFPPWRTALGAGLLLKVGLPIKVEYAWDVRRLWGRPRTSEERATELKSLLFSAGFQF